MKLIPTTGFYKIKKIADEILDTIDTNGGYGVPVGFLSEPYNTDLHKAMRALAQNNLIKQIKAPPNTHAQMLEFMGNEIWGKVK